MTVRVTVRVTVTVRLLAIVRVRGAVIPTDRNGKFQINIHDDIIIGQSQILLLGVQ